MGWFSSNKESKTQNVPWQKLTEQSQLSEIVGNKNGEKHIIFKHSTRCSISAMALNRFQKDWSDEHNEIHIWYLDLLNFREISSMVAEKTGVIHQSPQAIALKNGEVTYTATHSEINLRRAVKSLGE
jgi:bacillithiol system protein YtxJ